LVIEGQYIRIILSQIWLYLVFI